MEKRVTRSMTGSLTPKPIKKEIYEEPTPKKRKKAKKKTIIRSNQEEDLLTVEDRYQYTRYSFDANVKKEKPADSDQSEDEEEEEDEGEINYGLQSKLLRCAILHEFIYHVVHELDVDEDVPSLYDRFDLDKYLPANVECTPTEDLPIVDDSLESPYRHVVRIPQFQDAERGWFMVRDLLLGMPVSVFVLLVKLKERVAGLQEILDDPERRHIPLADLPVNIRLQLFNRQTSLIIEWMCLLLSAMGLMRVAPPFQNKHNIMGPHAMFFCGKKAYFYDTSSSGRGYALVTQPISQYNRYDYEFDTMEEVQQYWCHLKAVCWSTSLGARKLEEGQEEDFKSNTRKYAQSSTDRTPLTADYSEEIDEIELAGNSDGCAGFDAQLFAHLRRNWELHSQPNSLSTNWFLMRWQQMSARLSSYISEKVVRLEKNWNSYITMFLPTDMELAKKKKAELPILTQKTLESLSSNFRRHHNTQRIITGTKTAPSKKKSIANSLGGLLDDIATGQPSTSASTPVSKATPKSKTKTTRQKKVKDEPEDIEVDDEKPTPKQRKRKMDAIDVESKKRNVMIRSRFSANEYDMLVLIRSISYFLNPIHRFWLNPTVMRDIMHLHVPESRDKTVSSLLAASAREMLRPGRGAQQQYIVKTFSANNKMIEIRDKLAIQCKTDEEKNGVFWQAFKTAYKLIFGEPNPLPDAEVNDVEFQEFLDQKKMTITVADPVTFAFPRRSSKPETIEDVQHCVAFNVVMSTLVSEVCQSPDEDEETDRNLLRSDFLINSIPPAAISEAMQICRSDGLVSKVRNNMSKTHLTKNQVTVSVYYRCFFNHFYRKDLLDLLKDVVLVPKEAETNPTNTDNPAILLHMVDYAYNEEDRFDVDAVQLADFFDCGQPAIATDDATTITKPVTASKKVKQLNKAPMLIENININLTDLEKDHAVPSRVDVLLIICPIFECSTIEDPNELQNELNYRIEMAFGGIEKIPDATTVLEAIRATEFYGASVDELKAITDLSTQELNHLFAILAELSIAFPCGVDCKRYVAVEHSLPWLIKTDTHRFGARPWVMPNGSVNWPALRWMSESVVMFVYSKPGILLDDLVANYTRVLSPILVHELVELLVALDCCTIETRESSSLKLASPFATDAVLTETKTFVRTNGEALSKFAIFFAGIALPEKLLHRKK